MDDDDDERKSEENVKVSETVLFVDQDESFQCIDVVVNCYRDPAGRHQALHRLRQIFDKYLDCPTLLDASIDQMVQNLIQPVQTVFHTSIRANDSIHNHVGGTDVRQLFHSVGHPLSALYALSKVRGRKAIQRFLPHGVDDLEPVWGALHLFMALQYQQHANLLVGGSEQHDSAPMLWESIYVLWNWMSTLSLIPFDSDVVAGPDFIEALQEAGRDLMSEAGPVREAAAAGWAAWLSRSDVEKVQLDSFVQYATTVILKYTEMSSSASQGGESKANLDLYFQVLGVMQVVTTLLKVSPAQREFLMNQLEPLWDPIVDLDNAGSENRQNQPTLLRKYLVKWWTRTGCGYLPPSIAPWRYQMGRRSLFETMHKTVAPDTKKEKSNGEVDRGPRTFFPVPDRVEDAMGRIIEALSSPSTVVRWSSAKGVGRVTERLPEVCADDVLDSILQLFQHHERDNCWHGGCLALAEMARRGLLLPQRLADVIPLVVEAIQYDVRRGPSSIGMNVRDAACYVYWAFSRAYHPRVLLSHLATLSEAVILTSLFDREVNCRRAASAAFQEAVGRQGTTNFPRGIEILTKADYFSLGDRIKSYTSIAKSIAEFEEYTIPIFRHLYTNKLFHWDASIRSLSSKSLHLLAPIKPSFICSAALPYLIERCMDQKNLFVRHGAVLGVAEIVLALAQINKLNAVSSKTLDDIANLVSRIEKARLYRGRGGEIMRCAVCRLVECISTSKLSMTVPQQVGVLDSIDSSIPHPSEQIQQDACSALGALMYNYFPVGATGPSERLQSRVVDKFVHAVLTSENPSATRGYALALGHLPAKLLAPSKSALTNVMNCLHCVSRPESLVGGCRDAETRRNALLSLNRLIRTVGIGPQPEQSYPLTTLPLDMVEGVFETYLGSMADYNTDRRGDVGSWSRLAAMDGITELLFLAVQALPGNQIFHQSSLSTRVVGASLKQLAEKLDVVRKKAGNCLERILLSTEAEQFNVAGMDSLKQALGFIGSDVDDFALDWADPLFAFAKAVKAASVRVAGNVYFENVMLGLVTSIGGLTEHVSQQASSALIEWVKRVSFVEVVELADFLVSTLATHRQSNRLTLGTLKTLLVLFRHQCLDTVVCGALGTSTFAVDLEAELRQSAVNSRDVYRLLAVIDMLTAFISAIPREAASHDRALALLCKLLSHAYPRIRSHTAEQLYLLVLERAEYPSAEELLLKTAWSTDPISVIAEKARSIAYSMGMEESMAWIEAQHDFTWWTISSNSVYK